MFDLYYKPKKASAFSLLEVVFAVGILATLLLTIMGVFIGGLNSAQHSSMHSEASEVAREAARDLISKAKKYPSFWDDVSTSTPGGDVIFVYDQEDLSESEVLSINSATGTYKFPDSDTYWKNASPYKIRVTAERSATHSDLKKLTFVVSWEGKGLSEVRLTREIR